MDVYSAKKKELYLKRKNINLYCHPIKTLTLFCLELKKVFSDIYTKNKKYNKVIGLLILTILFLFKIRNRYENLNNFLIYIEVIIWWLSLGVLSSIGLGCGMHSGLLFLFPHIYFICSTSEYCNSLNFDSRGSMWRSLLSTGSHFECIGKNDGSITFSGLFFKIYPYCLIWGIGTALGELPPYLASYYSAKSRLCDDYYEQFEKDITEGKHNLVTSMKIWMINFIKRHGSISIFFLSCWPNVMFDLCGICCGHFLMPFKKFFIPLIIGKGIVKTLLQCIFIIFLFSNSYKDLKIKILRKFLSFLPLHLFSENLRNESFLENFLDKKTSLLKHGKKNKHKMSLMLIFNVFFFVILIIFFISCINQIAQKYQKSIDEEQLKRLKRE